ncbi:MAG: HNH endonuclease [Cyanobium sp.]
MHARGVFVMTTIDRPTLVLKRDWAPVGVATVARSLALVATDRARMVDSDTFMLHAWSEWAALRPAADELSSDHVVPQSRGGTSTWENCVLACLGCNRRKADRTPP